MIYEASEEMNSQISLILIEFGGEEFAIDLLSVKEIIKAGQIRRLPKGFDFIEGIYNYRGDIIHIINPKKKLRISENKIYQNEPGVKEHNGSENQFIIIINIAGGYIGFLVDRIINVAHIGASSIEGLSPIIQTNIDVDCMKGIVKFEDRPRIWLNLNKILTRDEKETIQREINQ